MYKILFHKSVKNDLKGLPKSHLEAIKRAITERLSTRPHDFKALSGKHYKGLYRLRVSDFRIIHRINEELQCVIILAIGHRREIYKNLDTVSQRN